MVRDRGCGRGCLANWELVSWTPQNSHWRPGDASRYRLEPIPWPRLSLRFCYPPVSVANSTWCASSLEHHIPAPALTDERAARPRPPHSAPSSALDRECVAIPRPGLRLRIVSLLEMP